MVLIHGSNIAYEPIDDRSDSRTSSCTSSARSVASSRRSGASFSPVMARRALKKRRNVGADSDSRAFLG